MGTSKREEMLSALFDATVKGLREKLESGDATAKDFEAAAKVLRDNGIDVAYLDREERQSKEGGKEKKLPFALVDEEDAA